MPEERDEIEIHNAGDIALKQIPPRTLNERLRLAIRWCRAYHREANDPNDELAQEFIWHLGHMGLKLVCSDGSDLKPEQISKEQRS
jgi:hypothetical protein